MIRRSSRIEEGGYGVCTVMHSFRRVERVEFRMATVICSFLVAVLLHDPVAAQEDDTVKVLVARISIASSARGAGSALRTSPARIW